MADPAAINALIVQVREVRVEDSVQNYMVRVARQTRAHRRHRARSQSSRDDGAVPHGAGVGRDSWRSFVTPDHVKFLAPYVLTHRIMISPQMRLRGRTPEEVLADVVESVPVPVAQP